MSRQETRAASRQVPNLRRLIPLYVLLIVATVIGAVLLIDRGQREHAQPSIAGGYDLSQPNPCFGAPAATPQGAPLPSSAPAQPPVPGASFDIQQSGEFLSLSNPAGSLGGKLRLHPAGKGQPLRMTGTIDCVSGGSKQFAGAASPGTPSQITGTVSGVAISAALGRDPPDPGTPLAYTPSSIAGIYKLAPRSACFGGSFVLDGGGSRYTVKAGVKSLGTMSYAKKTGALTGDVGCLKGGLVRLRATAAALNLNNVTLIPLDVAHPAPASAPGNPVLTTLSGLSPGGERFTGTRVRDAFDRLVAAFFIAVALVMLLARLFGILAERIGQPRVMGEVVAGLTLGPSVLGAISPQLQGQLFPPDILPAFGIAANLGLIFYMFLVGLEVDHSQLKGRVARAVAISNTSVAVPMLLGIAIAIPLYKLLAPEKKFAAFALFLGVAMSITAFPVLARILAERRMLKRPLGVLVITCASIDDVVAWFLIALATTVAVQGGFGDVATTIGLAVAFCLAMGFLARPLIARVSDAFDQSGRVPAGWVAIIFAGVLLSAWATDLIGIAVIFGGFIMGMVMPRDAGLTEDVTRRMEDFVVVLLLPMFFAYTGLQLNVGQLNSSILWAITLALIGIAIAGKLFGAMAAARVSGFGWRESAVIGTLMNTRGLTELIVLNLALQKGVISSAVFTMMVLMALVTTFMAGPILKLIDRRNEFGAPVEEELVQSRERSVAAFPALVLPESSILVAAQTDAALPTLLELAEPLARSEPPRELILVRLVRPPRGAGVRGGLQSENALVRRAEEQLERVQEELIASGIATRSVAFSSAHPGDDLARLTESEEIDLLLVDGRRPLLGEPVPLVDIKPVLERAPCDVGVLVAREGERLALGPGAPILVPFGGADHDWSALELGAWLSSGTGAPLKLLGAAGATDEAPAVKRRLQDAGMLVRDVAGIATDPIVVEDGRQGILQAARGARLLVVGLSERWKEEGLGETRSQLARSSAAPILFVRRGQRAGALAPRDDFTRFGWSSAGLANR
jgi:Kef-type K+ transport system membrane component KefB